MKNFITVLLAILIISCSSEDDFLVQTNNQQINKPVDPNPINPIVTPPPPPAVTFDYTKPPTQAELATLPTWTETPDPVFEQVLIDRGFDDVLDGKVLTSNISTITGFERPDGTVMGQIARMFEKKNITNTKGLENFIGLQFISFWQCPITTIDVSNLKRLKILGLSECPIDGTVDISQNLLLEELNFHNDSERCDDPTYPFGKTLGFTSLNVSKNLMLKRIFIQSNLIQEIDVSMLTNLEQLNLGGSAFLSGKTGGGNPIQSLDLSKNTKLNILNASGCQLNYLNIKNTGVPRTCITIYNPDLKEILVDNVSAILKWAQAYPLWYSKDSHTNYIQ